MQLSTLVFPLLVLVVLILVYLNSRKTKVKLAEISDLNNFLLQKSSVHREEFTFLLGLFKPKSKINEKEIEELIHNHFKQFGATKLLDKQMLYRELETIFKTYLADLEDKGKICASFEFGQFDFTIPSNLAKRYITYTRNIYSTISFLTIQSLQETDAWKEAEMGQINKKDYGQLSTSQIQNRQVYAAIRAYAEIMKCDDDIHPHEIHLVGVLTEIEKKKLIGDYDMNSEEFKFVWSSEENLFTSLKTYNKEQQEIFYNNLFIITASDAEFHQNEMDFILNLYHNITGSGDNIENSMPKVIDMFEKFMHLYNTDSSKIKAFN